MENKKKKKKKNKKSEKKFVSTGQLFEGQTLG